VIGDQDAAFRSAERAWLEPPTDRGPWVCPACGEEVDDEVCECGEREPEPEEGPDPDDERDRMLERQWEDEGW
jgi:hypothetical protein